MSGNRSYNHIRKKQRDRALRRYQKDRLRNQLAEQGPQPFIIVLDHLKAGFNVPKIFRSAEAFGAREIHLVNVKAFDPSPARGAFRNVPARFFDSFGDSYALLRQQGYTLFALSADCDNSLTTFSLPEKSAFIMGNEGVGHSFNREYYPDIQCLAIPQYGQVESLNVSIASSIVMYEYVRQFGKINCPAETKLQIPNYNTDK